MSRNIILDEAAASATQYLKDLRKQAETNMIRVEPTRTVQFYYSVGETLHKQVSYRP